MPRQLTAASVAAKWAGVTAQRTGDYESGVKNPRKDWAQSSVAASSAYQAGVQDAIKRDAFSKGVNAAGNATYQKGAIEKGVSRFAEGVSLGQNTFASKIAPVLQTIESTQLPQRYAKGDPRNVARVSAITQALRKLKTGTGS